MRQVLRGRSPIRRATTPQRRAESAHRSQVVEHRPRSETRPIDTVLWWLSAVSGNCSRWVFFLRIELGHPSEFWAVLLHSSPAFRTGGIRIDPSREYVDAISAPIEQPTNCIATLLSQALCQGGDEHHFISFVRGSDNR
eukprot:PhM_4_TR18297/c0_g1_i1/m.21092